MLAAFAEWLHRLAAGWMAAGNRHDMADMVVSGPVSLATPLAPPFRTPPKRRVGGEVAYSNGTYLSARRLLSCSAKIE